MEQRVNIIQISIDDWIGDGHSVFDQFWYYVEGDLDIKDAHQAFLKSQNEYPNLDPSKFHNFKDMGAYLAWFIGLSGIKLNQIEVEHAPPSYPPVKFKQSKYDILCGVFS